VASLLFNFLFLQLWSIFSRYRLVYCYLWFKFIVFNGKNRICKASSCENTCQANPLCSYPKERPFLQRGFSVSIFRQLTSSQPTTAVASFNFNLVFFKICLTKKRTSKNFHRFHEVILLKTQITKDQEKCECSTSYFVCMKKIL